MGVTVESIILVLSSLNFSGIGIMSSVFSFLFQQKPLDCFLAPARKVKISGSLKLLSASHLCHKIWRFRSEVDSE
jgi:hypothetical protein